MEKNKNYSKGIYKVILFAVIAYFAINYYSIIMNFIGNILDVLFPFVLGGAVAFIINIPMTFLERKFLNAKTKKGKPKFKSKKLARILALLLSIIFIVSIFFLVIKLIVPELINVFKLLLDKVPYYVDEFKNYMEINKENMNFIGEIISKVDINEESVKNEIITVVTSVLGSSISLVGSVIGVIADFVIAIVFAAYILTSKEKLKEQFKKLFRAYLSDQNYEKVMNVLRITRNTFASFFTVQCLEATILGTLCILGMLLFNIPYAVPIGVLVGVTALIPVVGAFIGIIVGIILILSVVPSKVIPFVVFVLILQQIEGNLIYPRVVGESVGLPGIWVLVAVSVGGSLFGVIGMLISVPTVSVIYFLLKKNVKQRLETIE